MLSPATSITQMTHRVVRHRRLSMAIPVLMALVLQLSIVIWRRFDGLYGQDAYGYYNYALTLRSSLLHLQIPPPFFWPIGYPAAIMAGTAVFGLTALAGQVVSMLAGLGVVALTYLLAADLMRTLEADDAAAHTIGLLAALITATCGQVWLWSITLMADMPSLLWATLAVWALVRARGAAHGRWLVLSAAALALAIITRWIYGLLILPMLGFWLLGRPGRRQYMEVGIAALVGFLILLPQLALSVANPGPVVDHPWLLGWSLGNAFRRNFATRDGFGDNPLPNLLFYAKAGISPRFLVPLFTPFLLLGLILLLRRRAWPVLLLLGGWCAVIFICLCGIPYQNFRYVAAILPAEMILTAYALWWTANRLRRWRVLLAVYVALGLLVAIGYNGRVISQFIDQKDADRGVATWVAQQVPQGSRVVALSITLTLQHYTDLDIHELFALAPADLQRLLADGRPSYLVVQVDNINSQWRGYGPELDVRWLQDHPGLSELGSKSSYTLFRIGPNAAP